MLLFGISITAVQIQSKTIQQNVLELIHNFNLSSILSSTINLGLSNSHLHSAENTKHSQFCISMLWQLQVCPSVMSFKTVAIRMFPQVLLPLLEGTIKCMDDSDDCIQQVHSYIDSQHICIFICMVGLNYFLQDLTYKSTFILGTLRCMEQGKVHLTHSLVQSVYISWLYFRVLGYTFLSDILRNFNKTLATICQERNQECFICFVCLNSEDTTSLWKKEQRLRSFKGDVEINSSKDANGTQPKSS